MTRGGRGDPVAGAHRMPPQRSAELAMRDVRVDALKLADSKTGVRAVPLGEAVRALILALPDARDAEAFLFPHYAKGRSAYSLGTCWRAVFADTKPGGLRLHDLRHSAASQAVMAGESLPLAGKLLGHRCHRTAAGYAYLADAHLVEASEKVGDVIVEAMSRAVSL